MVLDEQMNAMSLTENPSWMSIRHPGVKHPLPVYMSRRITMYDEYKKKYDEFVANQPRLAIKISLADGRIMDGVAWETTPMQLAVMIDKNLADRLVICKVNGELFDSTRVLEGSCALEFLDFDSDQGKQVFWHSSAHVLGEACELKYGCHLCLGPPVEEGFFYEMGMDGTVSNSDFDALNALAKEVMKQKQNFERLELPKQVLLEMFQDNPFKVRLIQEKIPDGTSTTVYRCGPLVDLCRGPHIPHTGRIKALEVTKNSSSYFLGDANNVVLQRVYGISFPEAQMLKEYKKFKAEAEKRDHRRVGIDQQLFFFHELSPGSCFFLPYGARIYNTLVDFIRAEYRKRGYDEVISPNMFNTKLWETSGHWQNYRENMFSFEVEKQTFALKPMNCPGHCLMFQHRERSYRELPIRFADFGVLHRNELSGALAGLTRVRRFQQDDAHIFCAADTLQHEIEQVLGFLSDVYGIFGFNFFLKLSTRPDHYLGELSVWEKAEKHLENALNKFGHPWEMNPGDGAFYGPKIDITIQDAHRRKHQCATIQLDFQLPERFDLKYRKKGCENDATQWERPVIIHRAVLGSVERMLAILTENYGGKWPLWLNPRQVIIVPVSSASFAYADQVCKRIHDSGLYVEVDSSDLTLNKKIRNADLAFISYVCVVGKDEEEKMTVNVRKATADGKDASFPVDEFIRIVTGKKNEKTSVHQLIQ